MVTIEFELDNATIANLAPRIQRREVSPVEIVESSLRRIERLQPVLGSFTTIAAEHAMLRAREAEQEIAQGRYRGPFHGIPYTLKDVVGTANIPTTWGDPRGVDYKPKESATIHTLLDEAGGILLGKVVSEIGRGQGGPVGCRNAWDPTRSPGTSSSGSGSATAASMGLGSIGTDTGGSVRHPGSNSNLVALRPTHGRISGFGVHASSVTTDQAGPLTKTVEDNAIMLQILGVYDPKDPISINEPRYDYQSGMQDGIKGIRIGVPVDDWVWKDWLTEEEESVCRKAISVLQELGASVTEVALPRAAEARSNSFSSRAPGVLVYVDKFTREQLDAWPEVGAGIDEALQESAVDYLRLQQHRALIRQEANEVLRKVDVIAMPTGSTYGDAWDAENIVIRGRTVSARSRAVYRNALASICGQPAISVPCGFGNNDRWPIGLMLQGRELREALLYRIAWAYEQATLWHKRHPNIDYGVQ